MIIFKREFNEDLIVDRKFCYADRCSIYTF